MVIMKSQIVIRVPSNDCIKIAINKSTTMYIHENIDSMAVKSLSITDYDDTKIDTKKFQKVTGLQANIMSPHDSQVTPQKALTTDCT